jgi:hypothetical protein
MYLVMINKDNLPQDVILVTTDLEKAQQHFLDTCQENLVPGNWDHLTDEDKDALLEEGYKTIADNSAVVMIYTDGPTSDEAIRDELTKQPHGDMTVAKIYEDGEIDLEVGMGVDRILELCGDNLDHCNAFDIQGSILFEGSDGKNYTITTESTIAEAHPAYAKQVMEDE